MFRILLVNIVNVTDYLNNWYLDTTKVTYYIVTSCKKRRCGNQSGLRPRFATGTDINTGMQCGLRSFSGIVLISILDIYVCVLNPKKYVKLITF